ncbi:MAG TPA: patatin-like phospholipase family protein [Candidatus Dormibacteraeota bacterium]|nr:patatin-like phospholipase family protein [Candidatus Dormibacteraeota bacterium]
MSLHDKLDAPGPKKLLALDGGGIRGIIAIEVLARIEALLRERFSAPDLVLAEYFDYIGGTSTGAIIATCLALGFSVERIRTFYLESGAAMFAPARMRERFRNRFTADNLRAILQNVIGEQTTLESGDLRTLLLLVMRNATTNSPWPISNNPRAMFNDATLRDCNLRLPLWQLVRASTAAPTYFPPEVITVGDRSFIFVDGAITVYNNPAFQLFLMATLEPYRVAWPVGEDRMLLVSVGTGVGPKSIAELRPEQMTLLYNASAIPSALIHAASVEQDVLCRAFGRVEAGEALDLELGDLAGVPSPGGAKLFTYARYDVELSRAGLDALGLEHIDPATVQPLDNIDHLEELKLVGAALAQRRVSMRPFERFLTHSNV